VVDAILPRGTTLTLDLCAELARLAPFGSATRRSRSAGGRLRARRLQTVGDGKHLPLPRPRHGPRRGRAIAFGLGGQLDRLRRPGRYDVAFRLEENRWNGTVAPQLIDPPRLRRRRALRRALRVARASMGGDDALTEAQRVFAELRVGGGRPACVPSVGSEAFRQTAAEPRLARALPELPLRGEADSRATSRTRDVRAALSFSPEPEHGSQVFIGRNAGSSSGYAPKGVSKGPEYT
jgi:hypothetical protein